MDFKRLIKTLHGVSSLLTLISTGLLLASFLFSFDAVNGYFVDGILPTLFETVFILGIYLSIGSIFAFRKKQIVKTSNDIKRWRIYTILAAALIILSQIFNLLVQNKYFTAITVGVCFFALFVFCCTIKGGYIYGHVKLVFLLLSSIFPLAMTIDNNSVIYRHSNSVENTLSSVFAIAFLIYILYEGKRLFSGEHSRWHFASMLLISHVGVTLSASYIIAYLLNAVNEQTRFYQMFLILIMSLFANLELQTFIKDAESHTREEWDEIEAPEEPVVEEIAEETPIEENTDIEKTDD